MNCALCATPLPDNSRYCLSCGADVSGDIDEQTQRIEEDPELVSRLQADLHGEYIIEELLERGGMAAVFLARDAQLGRKVAIKVLPPDLSHAQAAIARFKREARTAATLDHPHIVPIYRISGAGSLLWYVMKYIDGESLGQIIARDGALPAAQAATLLSQTAEALDFAHKKGVVHRDIKPDNIMVDFRGWVTVMDFGIAKPLDRPGLTSPGATIGTPYYMSPEQCAGGTVTPASDQYALGVVAYRMLSAQLPFPGDTIVEVVRAHVGDPIPPLPADVPAPLAEVVARALAKKAADRFSGILEFADAFARAARRDPTTAPLVATRRAIARSRVGARTPTPGIPPSAASHAPSRPGRRRGLRAAAWLMIAGAAAAAAIASSSHGITPDPRPASVDSSRAAPPVVSTAPPSAPAGGTAYVTVGSRPLATLTINGRRMSGNPVANVAVPAGPVRLEFQLRDRAGTWTFDTVVTVGAGERRNVGRIDLSRRRS